MTEPSPTTSASQSSSPTRGRLRWSLRTLLILTAIVAAPLAWIGRNIREGRDRIAVIRSLDKAGASVWNLEEELIDPKWDEILRGNWDSIEVGFLYATAPDANIDDDLLLKAACFRKLQRVWLDGQPITDRGTAALRNQAGLKELSISGCRVGDASMSHLATLQNLEELKFNGVYVTAAGVRQLRSLSNLKSLDLSFTLVSEPDAKTLRRDLPHCNIRHVHSTGEGQVNAVMELVRRGCFVARDPESFGTVIIVHREDLQPGTEWDLLEAFPDLQVFVGGHLPASASLARQLGAHQQLTRVTLGNVTPEEVRFLSACPRLSELGLHGIDITDGHLLEIGQFGSLEVLDIFGRDNLITQAGIDPLLRLRNLRTLHLCRVAVDDADLEHLPRLENLEVVNLSRTPVTNAALDHLLQLPRLRVLILDSTKITGEGAQRIMKHPQIEFADWNDTGILPQSFSRSDPMPPSSS